MMSEQFHIYYDFVQMCHITGFEPQIRAKTMDGDTLYRFCRQKIGVPVCPAFPQTNYQGLKAIPFKEPYYWKIYGTCLKKHNDSKVVEILKRFFVK